jgi:carbonic anhydrase
MLPEVHMGEVIEMINAVDALKRLTDGNRRFVSGTRGIGTLMGQMHRSDLAAGQSPFAVILGCSDSRVPVEIIFDQGLGDLFVIRVAGNIVAPSQIGSVEFAAEQYGTRLVVVLGHSRCGAIMATLSEIQEPANIQYRPPHSIHSIVNRIKPSIQGLLSTELRYDPEALLRHSVRANIRASAGHLRHGSQIIEQMVEKDGLLVVGAEYSLETGLVEFIDPLPVGG